MNKTKFHVDIEVYDNGQAVTVKRLKDRKIIGNRLFLNGQEKDMKEWINKTTSENALEAELRPTPVKNFPKKTTEAEKKEFIDDCAKVLKKGPKK